MDKQPAIESFKEKAKDLIEDYKISVGLKCEVGEGAQY
jgi:hypothetical protein